MLALLLLVACRLDVLAEEFDQTCTIDDDCVLVDEGNVCGKCQTRAAINADARDDFRATISERTRGCTIIDTTSCPNDADDAPSWVATCDAGLCTAVLAE